MAILSKVSKPALSPHWQVVKTLAAAGAASVEGTTLLTEAGTGAITLADGSYNGQMALLVNNGGSGTKAVTPASAIGLSSVSIVNTKSCLFIWVDDGTTTGWVAIGINA